MDPMILAWARAFAFTQLVEVPIYRRAANVSYLIAFGASAVTHPIVWAVFFSPTFVLSYEARLASAETFAVVVEAAILATRIPRAKALALAMLANGASVVAAMITRHFFGLP